MNEHEYIYALLERSIPFFSHEDIEKIRTATIAQAGFGGVGALAVELLARWGVKRFRLLDMDKYEISNINRQIFATNSTVGRYKAEVAAEKIKEINPYVNIERIYCEKLSADNVENFVKGVDVIVNAIDLASGHVLLHYYAKKFRIPLVHFHCMNVTGACVEVFDYRLPHQLSIDEFIRVKWINQLLYNYFNVYRINKSKFTPEHLEELDRNPPRAATLNFVTNLAGCLAVAEIIKLIIRKGKNVLYPKQIYIDPYNLKFKIRKVYWDRFMSYIKRIKIKDKK